MNRVLKKFQHYYSALGWGGVAMFVAAKLTGTRPVVKTLPPGLRHPVLLRMASTDLSVLKQVLSERHYDFPIPINPRVIVDLGANIGVSAVFFSNKYPEARVIAIEPEESNYEMMVHNVAAYPQIIPVKAAIWIENKPLRLFNPGTGHHGFQAGERNSDVGDSEGMVQGITVETLMQRFDLEHIDILKMDIEGAEYEVLQNSAGWIDRVNVIMVELHDHLKAGCQRVFQEATSSFAEELWLGETVARCRSVASVGLGKGVLA